MEIHEDFIGNPWEGVSFLKHNEEMGCWIWVKEGGERESWELEDDERSGRPKEVDAVENVEIVHSLVMCDRRRNLRDIASKVGIRFGAVQSILTDILGMSKVSARWVPRMLTEDQKRSRLDISRYLLSRYEDDPAEFMERVVTQDEILGSSLWSGI